MASIFVDESIHETAGFILAAFVVSAEDPTDKVHRALSRLGYDPGTDEYKSSAPMHDDRRRQLLRSGLLTVLQRTSRIAVVAAGTNRSALGTDVLWALELLLRNTAPPGGHHLVSIDEGILSTNVHAGCEEALSRTAGVPVTIDHRCDSREVAGIQLADLAAHHCSLPVLQELGIQTKMIKAGPNSGYDPDLEIELGWAAWATLRWHIINAGLPPGREIMSNDDMFAEVEGFGLFIAPSCPEHVATAARRSLGRGYLGCIH